MVKKSTISIAIPTYNRGNCLIQTLKKIDECIPCDVNVFIRDNGSSDQTLEQVKAYSSKTTRKIFLNENNQNKGIDYNIINVVRDANTDYVWLLGDDDLFTSDAYCKIKSVLDEDPNIGLIFCNYSIWDNNFEYCMCNAAISNNKNQYFNDGREIILIVGELLSFISCMVIKREQFISGLQSKPDSLTGTAVDFVWPISKILTKYSARYIAEPLIRYRAGDENRGFSWTNLTKPYLSAIEPVVNGRADLRVAVKQLCLERSLMGKIRASRIAGYLSLTGRLQVLISLFPVFFGFKVYWCRVVPWLLFPYILIKYMRQK